MAYQAAWALLESPPPPLAEDEEAPFWPPLEVEVVVVEAGDAAAEDVASPGKAPCRAPSPPRPAYCIP